MNNEISEVKLSYKMKVKASERPRICNSKASYDILLKVFDDDTIEYKESMKMLLLNRAGKVLGVMDISNGGTAGTTADIKVIMQCALLGNASGIILSHNHPSGNLQPSSEDTILTQRVKNACNVMDIQLLDHIILTSEHYYSFADEGRL
jgi:DNA repair proteins